MTSAFAAYNLQRGGYDAYIQGGPKSKQLSRIIIKSY